MWLLLEPHFFILEGSNNEFRAWVNEQGSLMEIIKIEQNGVVVYEGSMLVLSDNTKLLQCTVKAGIFKVGYGYQVTIEGDK